MSLLFPNPQCHPNESFFSPGNNQSSQPLSPTYSPCPQLQNSTTSSYMILSCSKSRSSLAIERAAQRKITLQPTVSVCVFSSLSNVQRLIAEYPHVFLFSSQCPDQYVHALRALLSLLRDYHQHHYDFEALFSLFPDLKLGTKISISFLLREMHNAQVHDCVGMLESR